MACAPAADAVRCEDDRRGLAVGIKARGRRTHLRIDGFAAEKLDHRRIAGLDSPRIGGQHRRVYLDAAGIGDPEQFGAREHIGPEFRVGLGDPSRNQARHREGAAVARYLGGGCRRLRAARFGFGLCERRRRSLEILLRRDTGVEELLLAGVSRAGECQARGRRTALGRDRRRIAAFHHRHRVTDPDIVAKPPIDARDRPVGARRQHGLALGGRRDDTLCEYLRSETAGLDRLGNNARALGARLVHQDLAFDMAFLFFFGGCRRGGGGFGRGHRSSDQYPAAAEYERPDRHGGHETILVFEYLHDVQSPIARSRGPAPQGRGRDRARLR